MQDFVALEPLAYAHVYFFEMADDSLDARKVFIDACIKYLSGHHGQTHFSVGTRVLAQRDPDNATNFEVSVHMIFKDEASFRRYQSDSRHEDFITAVAGISSNQVIYNSYVQHESNNPAGKEK